MNPRLIHSRLSSTSKNLRSWVRVQWGADHRGAHEPGVHELEAGAQSPLKPPGWCPGVVLGLALSSRNAITPPVGGDHLELSPWPKMGGASRSRFSGLEKIDIGVGIWLPVVVGVEGGRNSRTAPAILAAMAPSRDPSGLGPERARRNFWVRGLRREEQPWRGHLGGQTRALVDVGE